MLKFNLSAKPEKMTQQNLPPISLPTIYSYSSIVNSAQIKGRWNLVVTAEFQCKNG